MTEGSGEPRSSIGHHPGDGNADVGADVPGAGEPDWDFEGDPGPSTGRCERDHDAEIFAQLALPDEGLHLDIDGAGQLPAPDREGRNDR